MDIAIPIVFPDYKIAVDLPAVNLKVPDLLPKFDILPAQITVAKTALKLPQLGHAGACIINGASGLTKYYEYGRYDPAALGLTRRVMVSDVKIAANGYPTRASLAGLLAMISRKSGHGGRISGAFIVLPPGKFAIMLAYAQRREAENNDPKRRPYTLHNNSCMTFSLEVIRAGGASVPSIIDPRPNSFIGEVQAKHPSLEFLPPSNLTIKGIQLS